jgi:glycosyltransferase involved in cell wall biosynthesis
MFERLERFLYRRAAAVVCVTHAFRENLVRRGIDRRKLHVVTNGVDMSRFAPAPRDEALVASLGLSGAWVAGYIGTHGLAHGLETLLDAAALMQHDAGIRDVRVLFLGEGARKKALVADAAARGLTNVLFLDSVPKDDVPKYWALLDAAIIHLRPTEQFEAVIPSKLFEAMGMGIPVLLGLRGEAAGIVTNHDVGLVFEPGNAKALVEVISRLRHEPGLADRFRGRALAAAPHFKRSALAAEMLSIVERTVREA